MKRIVIKTSLSSKERLVLESDNFKYLILDKDWAIFEIPKYQSGFYAPSLSLSHNNCDSFKIKKKREFDILDQYVEFEDGSKMQFTTLLVKEYQKGKKYIIYRKGSCSCGAQIPEKYLNLYEVLVQFREL